MKKTQLIGIVIVLISLLVVVPAWANGDFEVEIDIKPLSCPSSINPKSRGKIPVAIITTDVFDATTVDPASVMFTNSLASPVRWAYEDFDGDGDIDLVLKFKTQECELPEEDGFLYIYGYLLDGTTTFIGDDWVNIVQ